MCFVVHAFGLNEPKTACQGIEIFPKLDPLCHLTSRARAGAAADDLSWQALALPHARRMLSQQPSKGQARWEQGLGVPPTLGSATGTHQQGLYCWLRTTRCSTRSYFRPGEKLLSISRSQPGQEAPLHPPQARGCPRGFGEGGRVETSAPTEGGWAWTSAPVLPH